MPKNSLSQSIARKVFAFRKILRYYYEEIFPYHNQAQQPYQQKVFLFGVDA